MLKKMINPGIIVSLIVVAMLAFTGGCKKSPQGDGDTGEPNQPQPKIEAPAEDTNQPEDKAEPAKEADDAEFQPQETEDEAAPEETGDEDSASANLEPIPLELPQAMFIGTPQTFAGVTNLEKPRGADEARPPFLAPAGTKNVALNKPVTSSDEAPIIGKVSYITDGDKSAADGSYVELGPFVQDITIDLQKKYNIYAVVIWHYHKQARIYFDVIVQLANTPDFVDPVTIFNNDDDNSAGLGTGSDKQYVETNEGKLIDAKGNIARYIKCYSNGNNNSGVNHYIEVEVYGKPVE